MVPKSAEWWQGIWNINFFCQSLKITSDILRCIRYSALQCHLAAAFYFKINVASFIFSDLSSDAWTFSCLYSKRYIIYGQNSQSQEFQQNNLLKSCIGSLVKSENCNRKASPPDLAHCAPPPPLRSADKSEGKASVYCNRSLHCFYLDCGFSLCSALLREMQSISLITY